MGKYRFILTRAVAMLAGLGTVAVSLALPASSAGAVAQSSLSAGSFQLMWTAGPFNQDKGSPIAESSPVVANLDSGGPAAVVGDRAGYLYAYHLANGSAVAGWPAYDGGAPIDSTPSVTTLQGAVLNTVFVGSGNAQRPDVGGYSAYAPNGELLWKTTVTDLPTDNHPAYGVQASLTLSPAQGGTSVFAGSLDQLSYALDAATGSVLQGWPFFSADSVFSTAAAADLYGTGQQELIFGGASTAGLADGQAYSRGGHLRIVNGAGQLLYDYDFNQEVDSSPAVGDFLAAGAPGIVVGTGSYWRNASDTDRLDAFSARLGGPVWSDLLDGTTSSSPALADVEGNGSLQVVEGTDNGTAGSVWVLDGATGAEIWHQPVVGRVIGSVVTADLTGGGYQDLLVPTTHGVEVLDGRSGSEVAVLGRYFGFQNSPLVTDDPNGTVGITIAGYNGNNEGIIQHYEIAGSSGAEAVGGRAWPMFHHDASLSGASAPLPNLGRATPGALVATGGNGQVSLSWAPPVPGGAAPATGYNIYVATQPGQFGSSPINGGQPVATNSYTATGLTNGTTYYFQVTAVNSAGEGAPSNEASAMPAGPPGAPASLVAAPANGEVQLTWSAPASDGGAPVTAYNVYLSSAPGSEGTKLATVTGTTYLANSLSNGTTYYFQVTAVNSAGEGAPSAQVPAVPSASLPSPSPLSPPVSVATAPPAAPVRLKVIAGDTKVKLAWAPPPPNGGPPVTSYNVYIASAPEMEPSKLATVTAARYTANGLLNGTPYYVWVTAVNSAGEGPPSVKALAKPLAPMGYRLLQRDGKVHSFGGLASYRSGRAGSAAVGIAPTPDAHGYWTALSGGGVLASGDAHLYGSMHGKRLNRPVVGVAATPDGRGYWLVAADGAVFAFGDAGFYGSLARTRLNAPIVGVAGTADGQGYWLVAADGGVFAFGDAVPYGTLGGRRLNAPIVGIAATLDGRGYWLVAADGGIFSFGDAVPHGSLGGRRLNAPIVGITPAPDGRGYWLVASNGGVFSFGDAGFFGSLGKKSAKMPVVAIGG